MEISALIAALKEAAEKLEELQKENEELKASNKRLMQVLWDLQ